jgi:hypothetical protein
MSVLHHIHTVSETDLFCSPISAEIPFSANKSAIPDDDINGLIP